MSERCIHDDWELRNLVYELWIDSSRNWWLSGGHKPGWVLTEDDFDPPLTDKELQAIWDFVNDWDI